MVFLLITLRIPQVASFGDFFAEKHVQTTPQPRPTDASSTNTEGKHDASAPRKRHGAAAAAEGPVETLTYRDPFAGVYKKYVSRPPSGTENQMEAGLIRPLWVGTYLARTAGTFSEG